MSSHRSRSTERGRIVTALAGAASRRLAPGVAVLALLIVGLAPGVGISATEARQPKTHTVTIEGTSFQPDRLTVAVGDTVVWINKDPFPHTATSTAGAFDSGSIAPEKSWTFKAAKTGQFSYICSLHPTMKAQLTVE
jgi:plastocyanin